MFLSLTDHNENKAFLPVFCYSSISFAVHFSVARSKFYFLTIFNRLFYYCFVFINYLTFRSNNFVFFFYLWWNKTGRKKWAFFVPFILSEGNHFDICVLYTSRIYIHLYFKKHNFCLFLKCVKCLQCILTSFSDIFFKFTQGPYCVIRVIHNVRFAIA